MSAPRTMLFALLAPAALLSAHAQAPSPRDIAEHCAAAQRAAPAATRPASGVYILERFEILDSETAQPMPAPLAPEDALEPTALGQAALSMLGQPIARIIEAQLEAEARLSWVDVDADARTATIVGTSNTARRRAIFTPDFSCLVPEGDDTESMRIENVDSGRFAMQIRAFATYRLTWRRVEDDSAALAEIRRLRDEAATRIRESDARHQAHLEALAAQTRTLPARATLPGNPVVIALPADASVLQQDGGYRVVGPLGRIELLVDPDPVQMESLEEAMDTSATHAVTTDDGARIKRDPYATYRVLASTPLDGRRFVMSASVKETELPMALAIWRSLKAADDGLSGE
ncbi:hypothetical protein [Luteimonas terrae]|uniref:Uncharacterized protein n=1 Tax=Luteimonas terrae TaxID=1530191 RepID=A0ABU1Y0R9_9GAMM|nr:hypothetical protein [Luteimonas terrae]MDR7194625.1 hypothetical protein [Luteimonas terrae]